MAISQYTGSYSSPNSDMREVVANNVGLLDKYIFMQTGEYEYTALIKDIPLKKVDVIRFTRSGSGYSYIWNVSHSTTSDFNYNVSNELYVYSNMNVGKSLELPVQRGVVAYSMAIIISVLSLAILFKGVLFKCLKRR